MACLLDTNVLLRLAEKNSPKRGVVLDTIRAFRERDEILCYTPQVLAEFWNVCTRPITARGGLGLSLSATTRKADLIEKYFEVIPDNRGTFVEWRRLVIRHKITGVAVHDAKLVASMIVYDISTLITFNKADFARFPEITALEPGERQFSQS